MRKYLTPELQEVYSAGINLLLKLFGFPPAESQEKGLTVLENALNPLPDPVVANILSNLDIPQLERFKLGPSRLKRIITEYYLIERKAPVYVMGRWYYNTPNSWVYRIEDGAFELNPLRIAENIVHIQDTEIDLKMFTNDGAMLSYNDDFITEYEKTSVFMTAHVAMNDFTNGVLSSTGKLFLYTVDKLRQSLKFEQFPMSINLKPNIVQVSSSGGHIAAVSSVGTLYTMGFGGGGALCNGRTDEHHVYYLTPVPTDEPVRQVSCGAFHTAFTTSNDNLYTCGLNDDGQLGIGDLGIDIGTPRRVDQIKNVVQVSCGDYSTAAVVLEGYVYFMGLDFVDFARGIKQIPGMQDIVQVSCGFSHVAGITSTGLLYTWGDSEFGALGDGNPFGHTLETAFLVPSIKNVVHVECGNQTTSVILGIPPKANALTIAECVPSCHTCAAYTSTMCPECDVLVCGACFGNTH